MIFFTPLENVVSIEIDSDPWYRAYYDYLKLTSHYKNRHDIYLILNLSLCTHCLVWLPCMISFVWSSPNCEQREKRQIQNKNKRLKREIKTATPCFPLGYRGCKRLFVRTFGLPFYASINRHVQKCMYEIDFCSICIGPKGVVQGYEAAGTHAPSRTFKSCASSPVFRQRVTPLGTDCQTKYAYL